MHHRLLEFLRCPACDGHLSVRNALEEYRLDLPNGSFTPCGTGCSFEDSPHYTASADRCASCWRTEVTEGELHCRHCGSIYAITEGVPRMVSPISLDDSDGLRTVKEHTRKNFGFEWLFYARHGWDYGTDKVYDPNRFEVERENFFWKSLVVPEEFEGKVILDAGCGNGRYSLQAKALGATDVIGVDLSDAVDAAYPNHRNHPNVHIVQGDIFRLPIARNSIDRIFSLGVLMHTGNARRAYESLLRHLRPGGVIAVHLYRRGNAIYEWVDDRLRRRTIHMDLEKLLRWSRRGATFARAIFKLSWLTGGRPALYELMNCFIRLEHAEHNVFDWYSAPVASHHTYDEARRWMRENELEPISDHDTRKSWLVRKLASPAGGVTFKGRKRMANEEGVAMKQERRETV